MVTSDILALVGLVLTFLGILVGGIFWMASIAAGMKRIEEKVDAVGEDVKDGRAAHEGLAKEVQNHAIRLENHGGRLVEIERHGWRPGNAHG